MQKNFGFGNKQIAFHKHRNSIVAVIGSDRACPSAYSLEEGPSLKAQKCGL